MIVVIVFALVLGIIYYAYLASSEVEINLNISSKPAAQDNDSKISPKAIMKLESSKQNYSVGEEVAVKVLVDTQGNPVDGADVLLAYSGSVEPGSIDFLDDSLSVFNNVMGLKIDQAKKEIRFSALSAPGKNFTGQGEIAVLNFASTGSGQAKIEFVFERGSTIDSNVSYFEEAQDILWQTTDLELIISAAMPAAE